MAEKCFCHLNGYAVKDATARKKIAALEKLSVNNFEPFTKTGDNVVKFSPLEHSKLDISVFIPPLQEGRGVPTPGNYRAFMYEDIDLDIRLESESGYSAAIAFTPKMFPCGGLLNVTNGTLAALKRILIDGGIDGERVSGVDHIGDAYRGWLDVYAIPGSRVWCTCLPSVPITVYGEYRVGIDDTTGRLYVQLHMDHVDDQENGVDQDGDVIPGSTNILDKFNYALHEMHTTTDIGVQVVYEPEDPIIHTLHPNAFNGLSGENTLSVDVYLDQDHVYKESPVIITVSGTSSTLREFPIGVVDPELIEEINNISARLEAIEQVIADLREDYPKLIKFTINGNEYTTTEDKSTWGDFVRAQKPHAECEGCGDPVYDFEVYEGEIMYNPYDTVAIGHTDCGGEDLDCAPRIVNEEGNGMYDEDMILDGGAYYISGE